MVTTTVVAAVEVADTGVAAAEPTRTHPVKIVLTVVVCCVVVALLVWQRHRLADLPRLLMDADWAWIGVAVAAQFASIGALAREQRRLISVRGGLRPLPSVVATTWAGNAISVSLPLVGSAAAAMFAYRRFTSIGVDKAVAAWALAISGVYSTVSFAAITAVGGLVSGSTGLVTAGLITVVAGVVPVVLLLAGLRRPRVHAAAGRGIAALLRLPQRLINRPCGNADQISIGALDQLTSLRLTRSGALVATFTAVSNWLFDLAGLTCALLALHTDVPWHGLILAWAVGSGASSLGLTPGGLGVVEIALGAALIGVGVPAGAAIAAALLYRATKLGLILVVGGMTLLFLRSRRARPSIPAVGG